jgi:hypothetical protein
LRKLMMAILIFGFLDGCATLTGTETSYKEWKVEGKYQGQGGSVEVVNGVEFWEHAGPDRPYKVIGLITQSRSDASFKKLLFGGYSQKQITDIVHRVGGDGVLIMTSKRFVSGYTTHMPANLSDTSSTTTDYSKASIYAVFQYIDSNDRAKHATKQTP